MLLDPRWSGSTAVSTPTSAVGGFERHTIRGLAKMQARMSLALAVMLAMAIGFISQDKPELMRSLVGSSRAKRIA
jgi:hypothetical protein